MMNLRILYNVLLVRCGVRRILPRDYVLAFPVGECDEDLIELPEHKNIRIDEEIISGKIFLRRAVAGMLLRVADRLGTDGCLLVHSGWRPIEEQNRRWERACDLAALENPGATPEELLVLARKFCADPSGGIGGGHQTGAAVDVEICRRNGPDGIYEDVDYGTGYGEHTPATFTHSRKIDRKAAQNRRFLCRCMQAEGFVNYPGEWWHFSYGDRMWAAYTRREKAIYGMPDPDLSERSA